MSTSPSPTAEQIDLAIELAREARTRSYSPYSDFPMGAAVVDADGQVTTGVLIENVSLGLAMCAERVALFSAVANGLTPRVLALCSRRTSGELTFPCGACRQVALEIAGPELLVVAIDPDQNVDSKRLADLLPLAPHRHTASQS